MASHSKADQGLASSVSILNGVPLRDVNELGVEEAVLETLRPSSSLPLFLLRWQNGENPPVILELNVETYKDAKMV